MRQRSRAAAVVLALACLSLVPALAIAQPPDPLSPLPGSAAAPPALPAPMPVDTQAPNAPLDMQGPSVPANPQAPSASLDTRAPSVPVDTQAPSAPLDTRAPSASLDTQAPSAPSAPLDTRAPSAPVDAQAPSAPIDTSAEEADKEQPRTAEDTKNNTFFAIKVIIGLVVLLVLAYLGGHRKVVRFEERLGIGGIVTAGFPFVALGLIASSESVGILNEDVLSRLRPILHFGLGWLGFIIGAQLDIRVLDRVPKGTAYLVFVEALAPFAITATGCGVVMVAFGMSIYDPATWRDAILLGTAAAMTAPRKFRGFANRTWHEGRGVDVLIGQLDEVVGVIGLVFITAYFRVDTNTAWQLPETAWVFVSLGLGVAIGILIFAMIRVPQSNAEFLAIVLGGIAFASGLAGYLQLSPIAIAFIAGVIVTNFPNEQRQNVFKILHHLERPVHLLFLMVAGALWDVTDWRGWILVPLFVAGRVIGKWTGVLSARTVVGQYLPANFAEQRNWVTPLSGLSIALVVSVQSLYQDTSLAWIVTAVIGGSIVTEFLVSRANNDQSGVIAYAPIHDLEREPADDLDHLDGGEPPAATKPPADGGGH
jgi:Kef-type K+ transport system membrane component KefB